MKSKYLFARRKAGIGGSGVTRRHRQPPLDFWRTTPSRGLIFFQGAITRLVFRWPRAAEPWMHGFERWATAKQSSPMAAERRLSVLAMTLRVSSRPTDL